LGGSIGGIVILVVVVALVFLWGATETTPRDHIGLSYGGGPFEGAHYQQTVDPGHGRFVNGWLDKLYLYPVTQRNYIISKKGEGDVGGADFVAAPSQDRIVIEFEVAVYFKLNVDKAKSFHENIGLKYNAWCNADDRDCSPGWVQMLHDSFRQQIEFALQRESRKYPAEDIFADQATLEQIQDEVAVVLKENVTRSLGDEYFCGPTFQPGGQCPDLQFVIKHITLPPEVVAAYERNRTSEIEIQTKRNEVEQRRLEAESIRVLNEALAEAGDQYVLLKAIESGQITFWVIPEGTSLTLPPGGQAGG
jgi:hypothetical protein